MPRFPNHNVAISAVVLLCISPVSAQTSEPGDSCEPALTSGLNRLVDLPDSVWRFVILDEPENANFIQFAWWGGVVVDLPLVALDAEQQQRAVRVFRQVGAGTPVLERGPDGARTSAARTFQHDFGRDTTAAARFGCAALRSIYQVSEELPVNVVVGGD